MDGREHLSG